MSGADDKAGREAEQKTAEEDEQALDYVRPTMPFEREASISPSLGRWSAIGFEFGLYVLVFFLGGLWLDGKFGTRPWWAAAGALLGVAWGMYVLIRRIAALSSDSAGGDGDPPSAG